MFVKRGNKSVGVFFTVFDSDAVMRYNKLLVLFLCSLSLLVSCEKLEVPSLEDDKEDEKTEVPEDKPVDGDDAEEGSEDSGEGHEGDRPTDGSGDDEYQGWGSLENQINYGGTEDKPFRAWDLAHGELGAWILAHGAKLADCWVEGYIVGYVKGTTMKSARLFELADRESNVLIADDTLDVSVSDCVPVQLSTGSSYVDVREALNLVDNPDMLRSKVIVLGTIAKYMGVAGVRNTREHL